MKTACFRTKTARALFIAACLACCGGARGGRVRIACIGDSITYGAGLADRAAQGYPARLQQLLGEKFEVRNFGNSGRGYFLHTKRGKEMRGYRHMASHREALAWLPHIVICNLGINDNGEYVKLWANGSCPRFKADVLALMNDYRALPTRPRLFMWTRLAGLAPGQHFHKSAEPFLMQRELREAARELGAVEIDMQNTFDVSKYLLPDRIHPNAAGAERIARITAEALAPYLDGGIPFRLPALCADHAALPAGRPFILRGTAPPGARVGTPFGEVAAAGNGVWEMAVPARPATARPVSWTFRCEGRAPVTVTDIVFGRLLLFAGQSNMAMTLGACGASMSPAFGRAAAAGQFRMMNWACRRPTDNKPWTAKMIAEAKRGPMFTTSWARLTRANAAGYSAIAAMTADRLAARGGAAAAPVGIIQLAVGGAPAEAFAPGFILARRDRLLPILTARAPYGSLKDYLPEWPKRRLALNLSAVPPGDQNAVPHPFAPEAVWRAAEHDLDGIPLDACVWYQGESNASTTVAPDTALPAPYMRQTIDAVIDTLREGRPGLPILMVELVGKMNRPWAPFRAAQRAAADARPGVRLIPTDDLGDPDNVHPKDKAPIADRIVNILHPDILFGGK